MDTSGYRVCENGPPASEAISRSRVLQHQELKSNLWFLEISPSARRLRCSRFCWQRSEPSLRGRIANPTRTDSVHRACPSPKLKAHINEGAVLSPGEPGSSAGGYSQPRESGSTGSEMHAFAF